MRAVIVLGVTVFVGVIAVCAYGAARALELGGIIDPNDREKTEG